MENFIIHKGESRIFHGFPVDNSAPPVGPAVVQPGAGGNQGTQWNPLTPGIIAQTKLAGEGADTQLDGIASGVTVVNVVGVSELGIPKTKQIQVTVPVGPLESFIVTADPGFPTPPPPAP